MGTVTVSELLPSAPGGLMMMQGMRTIRATIVVLVGLSAMAGAAQAPLPKALAAIERGQWQIRDVDADSSSAMCVADPRTLIQFGHAEAGCSRMVVENTPTVTTARFICPGSGHGRTTITVETGRLARIHTQGILGGAPFDNDYEARRTGACS